MAKQRYTLSEWGAVIDGAHEFRDALYDRIKNQIKLRELPDTSWEFQNIKTKGGILNPFSYKKREMLVIQSDRKGMDNYSVDVSVEPYGKTLTVHTALNLYESTLKSQLRDWVQDNLSWEDQTMLSDWASVMFRGVKEACEQVVDEVDTRQDVLANETKGPLAVW